MKEVKTHSQLRILDLIYLELNPAPVMMCMKLVDCHNNPIQFIYVLQGMENILLIMNKKVDFKLSSELA